MRKVNARRAWPLVAIVIAAFAAAEGEPHWLKGVSRRLCRRSADSAAGDLSLVLGLNKGELGTAVKQAVMRDGQS